MGGGLGIYWLEAGNTGRQQEILEEAQMAKKAAPRSRSKKAKAPARKPRVSALFLKETGLSAAALRECSGVCKHFCKGACEGQAKCSACEASCKGECEASCKGEDCQVSCQAGCTTACQVQAKCGTCLTACQGGCKGDCQMGCKAECTVQCKTITQARPAPPRKTAKKRKK